MEGTRLGKLPVGVATVTVEQRGKDPARGTAPRVVREPAQRLPSLRAPRGAPPTADEADPALHSPRASGGARRLHGQGDLADPSGSLSRREARGRTSQPLQVHMDTEALAKALPVKPATRATVPVLVHSSEVRLRSLWGAQWEVVYQATRPTHVGVGQR